MDGNIQKQNGENWSSKLPAAMRWRGQLEVLILYNRIEEYFYLKGKREQVKMERNPEIEWFPSPQLSRVISTTLLGMRGLEHCGMSLGKKQSVGGKSRDQQKVKIR